MPKSKVKAKKKKAVRKEEEEDDEEESSSPPKKKSSKHQDEDEEEQPKKKSKKEEPEDEEEKELPESKYIGEKQPRWVTEPPDHTVESPSGFRIHFWQDKALVMVTGKDWEGKGKDGEEGLHPGKVIKIPFKDFVPMLNDTLQSLGYTGPAIALEEEEEEEEAE
jgi:hypothetical protein